MKEKMTKFWDGAFELVLATGLGSLSTAEFYSMQFRHNITPLNCLLCVFSSLMAMIIGFLVIIALNVMLVCKWIMRKLLRF